MPFGDSTFANAGGAVADLFAAKAGRIRAQGYEAEAAGYLESAKLTRENIPLEESATKIKQVQTEREAMKATGAQRAEVAGFGFEESGSALDLLRSSASQAALAQQLIGEQGAIQVNAYRQQAQSYDTMAAAAENAAEVARETAKGSFISGIFKGVAAVASIFTGGIGGGGGETFSGDDSGGFSEDPDSVAQSSRGGGYGGGVFK